MQGQKEIQLITQKKKNVYGGFIPKKLLWKILSKKMRCNRKKFLNLGLLIVKNVC
jgi:hypothetical protein